MDSELRVFDSYGAEMASVAEGVVLFGAGNDLVRPHVLVEQDFSGPTQVSGVALEVFQGTASVTLRCHQHKPGWCEMRPYAPGASQPRGRVRIDPGTEEHSADPRIELALILGPGTDAIELGHLEFQPTPWEDYSRDTHVARHDPEPEMWLRWMVAAHQVRVSGLPPTVANTWRWLVENAGEVAEREQGNASAWAAAQAAEAWRLTSTSEQRLTWPQVQHQLESRPDLLSDEVVAFVMDRLHERTWRALRDPNRARASERG